MRYRFIDRQRRVYPIGVMCRVLAVTRSGYYAWRARPLSPRAQVNAQLVVQMRAIHQQSDQTYGSPRMCDALHHLGFACGRHRVARLMRAQGIVAQQRRRYQVTTDSTHGQPVAPDRLQRQFAVNGPNQVWAADLTYIWTSEGWLYLAVVLDLFSRRVVGWATSARLGAALATTALRRALVRRRRPAALHHSDRGAEYASRAYQALLATHRIQPSMTRPADCWGNAVVESFFATLKTERTYRRRYLTRADAEADLTQYIERWYNPCRRHSTLDSLSPEEFERRHAA
jgi:transposase InsO family protein